MNPIPPLSLPRTKLILKGRRPSASPSSVPLSSTILSFFDFLYGAVARRCGAAWAWRGQYLFRRVGVSSSVAAQRKDMAIMNSIKQLRRIYTIPSCPLSPPFLLDGRRQGPRPPPPVAPLLRGKCELACLSYSTTFISHFYYIPENGKCAKKGTQEEEEDATPPFRVGPGRAGSVSPSLPPSVRGQVGIYDSTPRNPER